MHDICKIFDKYLECYDLNDRNIKIKYDHSYRVMKLCEKYSNLLNYNIQDIYIAKVIGLFHDIGRFKQLKLYNTFSDKDSVDHAKLGVEILFNEGIINEIVDDEESKEIIKFAIENHSKNKIDKTNNKKALMHAKLIRDMDKLDIIYLEGYLDEFDMRQTGDDVSQKIIDDILNHRVISYGDVTNKNESIIIYLAYAFDINNEIVYKELKQNYKWYYNTINTTDKLKEIYDVIINYIDERIHAYEKNK